MSSSASDFYRTWPATMGHMKESAPDIARGFGAMFGAVMKDGAMSAKEKELVALGIAITMRCEPCIFAHVQKCITTGATPAQVIEAAGVAVMMQGGPAYTYVPKVIDALEQLASGAPA